MVREICEACRTAPVEQVVTQYVDEPFHLCAGCARRAAAYALRPLEWFNLAAKHGIGEFLLHDDFYDEDGAAIQPQMEVEHAELFPAPTLDDVGRDLERLIDYALTRWRLTLTDLAPFQHHTPNQILSALERRFAATRSSEIRGCVFELCARVLERGAETFIRGAVKDGNPYSHDLIAALAKCLPPEEGFQIALDLLRDVRAQDLPRAACSLATFRTAAALDWIEDQVASPDAVLTEGWGRLAAMSRLTWERVEAWLNAGRPLSLVALDALNSCWNYNTPQLREWRPKLIEAPGTELMRKRLEQHQALDDAPRVTRSIGAILLHLEEIPDPPPK
jgi:hypothetical protein